MTRSMFVAGVAALALSVSVSAQQAVGVGPPPLPIQDAPAGDDGAPVAFEVATVKQNKSGDPFILINLNAGRFTASNFPLRQLIQTTFRLQPNQLDGGPDWLGDRYDITGTIPDGVPPTRRDDMVKALLADRFKLVTHTETRELPLYALVMARSDRRLGAKITASTIDCAAARGARGRGGPPGGGPGGATAPLPKPGDRPPCGTMQMPGMISAGGITMARLAEVLSGTAGRTVIDRTGLTGSYEFDVTFTPDQAPQFPGGTPPPGVQVPNIDPNGPSLFTALQEQLGLKLEATRGPIEVTVIDRIERPTED